MFLTSYTTQWIASEKVFELAMSFTICTINSFFLFFTVVTDLDLKLLDCESELFESFLWSLGYLGEAN